MYAIIELVEAVGLWLGQRWGEYFALVATSLFLPYEIYDLTVKVTWLRIGALVVNLLLVGYLLWTKRLFGVRGGKRAYEAKLHAESVIEVEQAALAAAAAGQPGYDAKLRSESILDAEMNALAAEPPTAAEPRSAAAPAERPAADIAPAAAPDEAGSAPAKALEPTETVPSEEAPA